MNASVVVGQANFTGSSSGVSASTFNGARGISVCNNKLIVADINNNRILIWNSIPTSNNTPADVVVGQPNFTSSTANNGGISAATLNQPQGVACAGGKLLIADKSNNRILIYNSIPTTSGVSADTVVGQSSMTANTATDGNALNGLENPHGVTSDGTKLFIADSGNQRALIYNSIPISNGASANVTIGGSHTEACTASKLSGETEGIYTDGSKLFIATTFPSGAQRLLIWNSIPTSNNSSADVTIGTCDTTSPATSTFNIVPGGYRQTLKDDSMLLTIVTTDF